MSIKRYLNINSAEELEVHIDDIAQGGDGVGRWQNRVVFVRGGLPGEDVRIRLSSQKPRYMHGQVIDILKAVPERIAPRLPTADHMPWQHIAYPAQLRYKQAIVQQQLARLAGVSDVPVHPVLPATHPWGYRNTAHFHVQENRVGYYSTGSHQVVDLAEDPLVLPVLNDALNGLRLLLEGGIPELHSVTLRASAAFGYAIAGLSGTGTFSELATRWQTHVPALASVVVSPTTVDRPMATLHEELGEVVFSLSLDSFFQVHTAQASQLLAVIRSGLRLQSHERLLDAYSGAGTFALPLASEVCEVVAIEENPHAVADGERSAQLNDIANVRFVIAPVERVLTNLPPDIPQTFDAAILDPPRRGCHPDALAALGQLAPRRIAYVSCHPGILARDLRLLLADMYQLESIQPVDLFPQTPHIESVAFLRRSG